MASIPAERNGKPFWILNAAGGMEVALVQIRSVRHVKVQPEY